MTRLLGRTKAWLTQKGHRYLEHHQLMDGQVITSEIGTVMRSMSSKTPYAASLARQSSEVYCVVINDEVAEMNNGFTTGRPPDMPFRKSTCR